MDKELQQFIRNYHKNKIIIILIQLSIIILFLSIWQYLSCKNIISSFIFSSPIKIIKTISNLFNNNLIYHIYITLKEILISFTICFILSFIIAILFYLSNTIYKILDPFFTTLNSLPKIALGPILIIWFKASTKSIIVMSLLISIFVCIQTIYIGLINTNKYHILLFKSLKAAKLKQIKYLFIPSSFPSIISALKLNISMTLVGIIMGEFLVSKAGLGYLIIYGTQVFNLDLVYSSIVILIILSYIIYKPINILEKKLKNI